jgi:hypothetical protein
MALTALWTHGNAVIPERPENLTELTHFGFGMQVRLKPFTEQWCHVAMPTPAFLNGNRLKLLRVIILARSEIVNIRSVHAFDGNDRKRTRVVAIGGEKLSFNPDSVEMDRLEVFKGLGISMLLDNTTLPAPNMFFFGAIGADWDV